MGGFLCLGTALRLYNFWVPELWSDEYGTWWAVAGDWGDTARRVLHYAGQSPLYYFLVKLVAAALGAGPVALRLLSLICGVATVALAYPLAVRVFQDRHAGLLALAAFAVSERLIWYSQEARPYALALLCTMFSFLAFVSLLESERWGPRIGYVVATTGAFYAHYLFAAAVLIQVLYLFLVRGPAWLRQKAWSATFVALALLSLPGITQLVGVFSRREAMDWVPANEPFTPVRLIIRFLGPAIFSAVAFTVLAIGGREKEVDAGQSGGKGLVLLWFLLPIILFSVLPPLVGVSLLQPRYMLVAAPAAMLVVAWLMASGVRTGWLKWVPLAVFLTTTFAWDHLPALEASGTFAQRPNQGWRKAARYLESHGREQDLVLLGTGFIEGDLLAREDPDPLLADGLRWPLTSNLSYGSRYQILDLPENANERTNGYLSSLVGKAAQRERVWIIGVGSTIPYVARALIGGSGGGSRFKLRVQIAYGQVLVIMVEQDGPR